jgi:hypothetical protein
MESREQALMKSEPYRVFSTDQRLWLPGGVASQKKVRALYTYPVMLNTMSKRLPINGCSLKMMIPVSRDRLVPLTFKGKLPFSTKALSLKRPDQATSLEVCQSGCLFLQCIQVV